MDRLYSEFVTIRQKHAEFAASLDADIEQFNKRVSESFTLVEQHGTAKLAEKENKFNDQVLTWQNDIRDVLIERERLRDDLKNREDVISKLRFQQDELESKLKESLKIISDKGNIASKFEVANRQLLSEVERLSTQLLEARRLARDSITQYEDQCEEFASLREELADTKEELGGLKTRYDTQFTEYLRVQEWGLLANEKVEQLEGASKAAKMLAEQAQKEMEETVFELKSAKNEIILLKSRVSVLQTQVHDQRLEIEFMDAEVTMKASEALKRQTTSSNSSVEPSPRSAASGALRMMSRTWERGGSENLSPSPRRPNYRGVPALGLPRQRSGGSINNSVISSVDSGMHSDTRDADIEALQGYAAARDRKISALMKSEETLRSELSLLTNRISENVQLVAEASMLKTRVEFLTREVEKASRSESDALSTQLDVYIESTKRLEEQLSLSKLELGQLKKSSQSMNCMKSEIERLEKSQVRLLKRIEKLNSQVSEMDSLRDKILGLEERISSASIVQEPAVTSENRIRELNKELMSQSSEMTRLQTRIVGLERDLKSMEMEKFVIAREQLDTEIAFKESCVKYEERIGRLENELKEVSAAAVALDFSPRSLRGPHRVRSEDDGSNDPENSLYMRLFQSPISPTRTEYFDTGRTPHVRDQKRSSENYIDAVDSLVQQLSLGRGHLEEIRRIASYMEASWVALSPKSAATVAKDHARIAVISHSVLRFMDTLTLIEEAVGELKAEKQMGIVCVDQMVQSYIEEPPAPVNYLEQIARLEDELKEAISRGMTDEDVAQLRDILSSLGNRILRTPTPLATEIFFDSRTPKEEDPEDTECTVDVIRSLLYHLSRCREELEEVERYAISTDEPRVIIMSPRTCARTVANQHTRIAVISGTVSRFMRAVSMIEKAVEILNEERRKWFVDVDELVGLQHRVAALESALNMEAEKRRSAKLTIRDICDKTTLHEGRRIQFSIGS